MNYRRELIKGILQTDTKDVAIANTLAVFDKYDRDFKNGVIIVSAIGFVLWNADKLVKDSLELVKAKKSLKECKIHEVRNEE